MPVVRCPQCNSQMMVEPPDAGHEVECPVCMAAFVAPRDETPEPQDRRPLRRRDESPRSYNQDDDDDRPRRNRNRRAITAEDLDDAKAAILVPARGLILTGWIGLALHLIGGIATVVFGITLLDKPNLNAQDEETAGVWIAIGAMVAIFSIPYCIPIAIGGHKLLRIEKLKGVGWVYVAAIMGVSTVMLCGICSPFTWFAAGFGLWAIIALNNPDVQRVIEANAQNGRE